MKKKLFVFVAVLLVCACLAAGCSGGSKKGEEADSSTVTGVLEEKKDFMFIVTDNDGAAYAFSFDEKPEGLDDVEAGDTVTVTYTGTISEVDPFEGEVLSVKKE